MGTVPSRNPRTIYPTEPGAWWLTQFANLAARSGPKPCTDAQAVGNRRAHPVEGEVIRRPASGQGREPEKDSGDYGKRMVIDVNVGRACEYHVPPPASIEKDVRELH